MLENLKVRANFWGLLASGAATVESVQWISQPSRSSSATAKDAKYGFGRLIDPTRTEPMVIAKHDRPVVVVMAVDEFERLNRIEDKAKGAKFE